MVPVDNNKKCGIWEDGKRIHWFDEEQATAIKKGGDYSSHFNNAESAACCRKDATFGIPFGLADRMNEVKRKIDEVKKRAVKYK